MFTACIPPTNRDQGEQSGIAKNGYLPYLLPCTTASVDARPGRSGVPYDPAKWIESPSENGVASKSQELAE
jgi:hypothetical protein